jgi:hypothetical protein
MRPFISMPSRRSVTRKLPSVGIRSPQSAHLATLTVGLLTIGADAADDASGQERGPWLDPLDALALLAVAVDHHANLHQMQAAAKPMAPMQRVKTASS